MPSIRGRSARPPVRCPCGRRPLLGRRRSRAGPLARRARRRQRVRPRAARAGGARQAGVTIELAVAVGEFVDPGQELLRDPRRRCGSTSGCCTRASRSARSARSSRTRRSRCGSSSTRRSARCRRPSTTRRRRCRGSTCWSRSCASWPAATSARRSRAARRPRAARVALARLGGRARPRVRRDPRLRRERGADLPAHARGAGGPARDVRRRAATPRSTRSSRARRGRRRRPRRRLARGRARSVADRTGIGLQRRCGARGLSAAP